jgi:Flp pilus assembly pilin Flp
VLRLYAHIWMVKQRTKEGFRKLAGREEGATIAEYALLLAIVVIALITVLSQLSSSLETKISEIISRINAQ